MNIVKAFIKLFEVPQRNMKKLSCYFFEIFHFEDSRQKGFNCRPSFLKKNLRVTGSAGHRDRHYVKSVRIRSFSGPYFPTVVLNGISLRIQSKCGKMQTRKTLNTDSFYAVRIAFKFIFSFSFH